MLVCVFVTDPYTSVTMLAVGIMMAAILSLATYCYTNEAYPTRIRGTAVSVCAVSARIASISGPTIVVAMYQLNPKIPVSVFLGLSVLNMINITCMPEDKRGKPLDQISRMSTETSFEEDLN
jgi:MFS family permease